MWWVPKNVDQEAHPDIEGQGYPEFIVDKRIIRGVTEWKVKWTGWRVTQATWEPRTNLVCPDHCVFAFELIESLQEGFEKLLVDYDETRPTEDTCLGANDPGGIDLRPPSRNDAHENNGDDASQPQTPMVTDKNNGNDAIEDDENGPVEDDGNDAIADGSVCPSCYVKRESDFRNRQTWASHKSQCKKAKNKRAAALPTNSQPTKKPKPNRAAVAGASSQQGKLTRAATLAKKSLSTNNPLRTSPRNPSSGKPNNELKLGEQIMALFAFTDVEAGKRYQQYVAGIVTGHRYKMSSPPREHSCVIMGDL